MRCGRARLSGSSMGVGGGGGDGDDHEEVIESWERKELPRRSETMLKTGGRI